MQIFIEIRPLGRKLCYFENLVFFSFRKCSKASASTDAEFLHALTYHIDLENILSSCKSAHRRQIYVHKTNFRSKMLIRLMKVFGGGKLIGPLLIGLGSPIEVAPLRASTSEILNLASIAAYSSDVIDYSN